MDNPLHLSPTQTDSENVVLCPYWTFWCQRFNEMADHMWIRIYFGRDGVFVFKFYPSFYLYLNFIHQCQHFGSLLDDGVVNQSIPIVLPVSTEDKERLSSAEEISLVYEGRPVAIIQNPEFFPHNKEERCARTFGGLFIYQNLFINGYLIIKMIY